MTKRPGGTPPSGPSPDSLQQRIRELFQRALALHQSGSIAEAQALYRDILRANPGHFDSLHLLGVSVIQSGQLERGVELIDEAIRLNPFNASVHNNRANALRDLGRVVDALAGYERAIALKPDHAGAWAGRGSALHRLGRLSDALESYDRLIALAPDAEAWCSRGNVLEDLGRTEEALASYDQAIALRPEHIGALNNRGNVLFGLGRLDEARSCYARVTAVEPRYAEAWNNLGTALRGLRRTEEALAAYGKAIALRPDYADAWINRGNALKERERFDEALSCYDKAIALNRAHSGAWYNRGNALWDLRRLEDALVSYDQTIALKSDYADAHNARGNVLLDLRRPAEALASYDRAIATSPNHVNAYNGRGNALKDCGRLDEALNWYEKALARDPEHVAGWNNRGHLLLEMGRLDDAAASFRRALELEPDYDFLLGAYLHAKMKACDWQSLEEILETCRVGILEHRRICAPFEALCAFDDPSLQRIVAEVFAVAKYPESHALGDLAPAAARDRIRVGYYSANFHEHAAMHWLAEVFERHDGGRFETYAFSFGPERQDAMRERVSRTFHGFIDVRGRSDREVAAMSRAMNVDIAVDLMGYTRDARAGIFAERCAPIQVSYMGYPGTLGAAHYEYVIADRTVIPPDRRQDFAEEVVYLPFSYVINDSQRAISKRGLTRREAGLPDSGIVFCCFNNNHKILPRTFDSWMRILRAVPGSVLWLLEDNPVAAGNLRKEAEARGVAAHRLVFAARIAMDEHLARHRLADLFLDTLPYNAHTTASDALWAGLPVLTCIGSSFASRVAASVLAAMDLSELVAGTMEEYERMAVDLALRPDMLAALKARVADNRARTPLFDGQRFVRYLQAAFEAMHSRRLAGLAADTIEVGR